MYDNIRTISIFPDRVCVQITRFLSKLKYSKVAPKVARKTKKSTPKNTPPGDALLQPVINQHKCFIYSTMDILAPDTHIDDESELSEINRGRAHRFIRNCINACSMRNSAGCTRTSCLMVVERTKDIIIIYHGAL